MQTVLGINGITGKLLAEELIRRGHKVRGISRRPFLGNWEHVSADVLNPESLNNAIKGSEVVYFCVGLEYNIKVWQRDWLPLMDNVIAACLANKAKLVFLDNVYMYGYVAGEMTEKTPMNPTSKKGEIRKAVAEKLLDAFKNRGLKGCIARAADFYGPDCGNSMLTATGFENLAKGKTAQLLGNPDKVHSYTFTEDIAKSMATLGLDSRADGEIWHLPTAKNPLTGRQIVDIMAKSMGKKPKLMGLGNTMVRIIGFFIPILKEMSEMMYQYNNDYVFNSEKYERTFGDVSPMPYEKGLAKTAQFYKEKAQKTA
jgi:nucleoside-diphosphate-sugar epimerase